MTPEHKALVALLESVRQELEEYEEAATGESYNNLKLNAAIESLSAQCAQPQAGEPVAWMREVRMSNPALPHRVEITRDAAAAEPVSDAVEALLLDLATRPLIDGLNYRRIFHEFQDRAIAALAKPEGYAAVPEGCLDVGHQVQKTKGYPFPGEVRSVFKNRAGMVRYVIEATGSDYAGMLHIFSPDQIAAASDKEGV